MALMLLTALSSISTVGALWLLAELLDARREAQRLRATVERKLAERDDLTGLPKPLAARMPDDTETELLLQQPAVRAVLEAFPGATIAGVTTPWTPT